MRSLLLGTAAGLLAMSMAQASPLANKAQPAAYTKINGYYVIGGALPIKDDSTRFVSTDPIIGTRVNAAPGGGTGGDKLSKTSGPIIDRFTQKLLSSASYRGTPAHGFHHVLGKIPTFATKMIA